MNRPSDLRGRQPGRREENPAQGLRSKPARSSWLARACATAGAGAVALAGQALLAPPVGADPDTRSVVDCPILGSDLDCDLQRRVVRANALLANEAPGAGYVLRDRATGGVYRNAHADDSVFAASTVKLAMAVDLFTRDRAGLITLSAADRSLVQAMLHSSDDGAADTLWMKYWGADHMAFLNDFPNYGMTDLRSQGGYDGIDVYWGATSCTANDLDRLMQFVLEKMDPADTAYIVNEMQNVDADQQWGVWGAGASAHPGNKNGWSGVGGWVLHSVGFAGLGQRYTLSIMNPAAASFEDGTATDTRIAQILLADRE
ncbi:hypothetical protein [Segniliparus rugosus]|uniref:Tat pathway signal sequence n=1 Tax=Segniliparus rugosus (strain ATCC BAA-974 / DSM 45345 / CCUG 50838 / CIP 108380 / JCM 13579 / CDC 945) TaxID=679197 RepID=E5XMF1_SEGRC|nr:hypothetical protein [Segniliparus rugosus]EFV14481.1 hypothetical protein HMPREF9336_00671 [Segniliparus rugosus ATCC BAA-974]